jgi:hypothetical protein
VLAILHATKLVLQVIASVQDDAQRKTIEKDTIKQESEERYYVSLGMALRLSVLFALGARNYSESTADSLFLYFWVLLAFVATLV